MSTNERLAQVAVVIPCYNDGATVLEALSSAEGQSPGELVIVDDGSTDSGTMETLAGLAARGVKVLRQENAGLAAARMAGVAATSAPFIFPLDADDVLMPGALAALAHALETNPSAAAAWGDLEIFGEFQTIIETADGLDPWLLTFLDDVPVCALLRREALTEVGGWRLVVGSEDWDLWLSLAEAGRSGVRVPGVTLRYRRHGARLSARWLSDFDNQIRELRRRHPALFGSRRHAWRRSTAPWRVKLAFPLIEPAPFLSRHDKYRLYLLLRRPRQILRVRRLRRAAERNRP